VYRKQLRPVLSGAGGQVLYTLFLAADIEF
jgi:hypothetical protein